MIEFLLTDVEGTKVIHILGIAIQGMCLGFLLGMTAYKRMIDNIEEEYSKDLWAFYFQFA